MCKFLGVSRSYYYATIKRQARKANNVKQIPNIKLEEAVVTAFQVRGVFGTRKIKQVLNDKGIVISRKKIGKVMHKFNLKSVYNKKIFRSPSSSSNTQTHPNRIDCQFKGR